jgi:hypothetical protein
MGIKEKKKGVSAQEARMREIERNRDRDILEKMVY